jgi:hypothetical protein
VQEGSEPLDLIGPLLPRLEALGMADLAQRLAALTEPGLTSDVGSADLLTLTEAAEFLGLRSPNTVRSLAETGELEAYWQADDEIFIARPSAEAYLNSPHLLGQRRLEAQIWSALDDLFQPPAAPAGSLHSPARTRRPQASGASLALRRFKQWHAVCRLLGGKEGSSPVSMQTSTQGVGSPISNEAYNVITALQSKLEGLEAYRKYQQTGGGQFWNQLTQLDMQAVQLLTEELERLAQSGGLRMRQPGQTS